jgi:hypothetical protein
VIWALHLVKEQCDAGCTLADSLPVPAARCADGGGRPESSRSEEIHVAAALSCEWGTEL